MDGLLEIHSRFLAQTLEMNKYNSSNITVLPSIIFLFTNFLMIRSFCHRYTRLGITSFKSWFFREITFHWSFFYTTKLWFLFLRIFKTTVVYTCARMTTPKENTTRRNCHMFGLFLLTFLSTLPLILIVINSFGRPRIPNFLMWVGEDPWLRNEIGLAGHYLDRPPNFSIPKRQNCSYRTRRSSSAEETVRKGFFLRRCKSLDCRA